MALGAIVAVNMSITSRFGHYAHDLRAQYFKPGAITTLGLVVVGAWIAAQLFPFAPAFDVANIKYGLRPIAMLLQRRIEFSPLATSSCAFGIMAIAIILRESLIPLRGRSRKIAIVIIGILILKIFIVGRQLSAEALLGAGVGLAICRVARYTVPDRLPTLAIFGLMMMLVADGIRVDPTALALGVEFNWVPFRGHLGNDIISIADLIGGIWPYCALAFLTMLSVGHWGRPPCIIGIVVVTVFSFSLEWSQRFEPGRLGDITDVLIPMVAWTLPWIMVTGKAATGRTPTRRRRRRKMSRKPPVVATVAFMTATVAAGTWLSTLDSDPLPLEPPVDETKMYKLLDPNDLSPVQFDQFHREHPRLPAPSTEDLTRLHAENPGYIDARVEQANNGLGNYEPVIFAELAKPGSQDMAHLYERLLQLEFTTRGNEQVKPLTIAYDWLYDQWTPQQRSGLYDKVLDGCEFIINVIREQRLSPYNVYLYNSPLQALVACAIATYDDQSPRADSVMRFTDDFWNSRVLPVWRQIMGKNGGWHEGGEYVGIGIGSAIYQIPAMWRHATSEDVFKTEPGIAGFLDFLIYRTRPDGTYFRWGDAGFFNRQAPDRAALALEYGRNPSDTSQDCKLRKLEPTAWPWGPLADQSLCEASTEERLPLTKFFDGIGLVVARSDWSPDSTYVTFKAGDNYWSHSHLDQGAFTIFKRHALAIDSGFYGMGYGTDHHMNYAYQSIAHNLVTVTDPEDTVPAPVKDGHRTFANDGGQRRIGSGWGIEGAPLDLDEWIQKREIYHTATIVHFEDNPDYTIATADLTPAYTNRQSGTGTFSHRTKRVEEYFRTFIYDRDLDSVAIYDRVHVTNPRFQVRWLLHTQTKPTVMNSGFDVLNKGGRQRASEITSGLSGHVVLPRERSITRIGGTGFDFYVDGKNYDEGGKIYSLAERRRGSEPGEWRIELQPSEQQEWITFLVFLFPWSDTKLFAETVDCEESDDDIVCTLGKLDRHAMYTFNANSNAVTITHD